MIDINPSQTTPNPPSQPGPQGTSQAPTSPSPSPSLQEAFPRYVPPAPPEPTPSPPPPVPQERGINKGLIFVLILLLFAFAGATVLLGYQNYQLKQEIEQLQAQPAPTTVPTATPTLVEPIPTPDSTAGWETYSNNEYTFKYPKGLESDTGAAGQGFESIRVQFMGPKQVASGRTETSLFDGYSFVVTKISSNTTKTTQQQAQEERANSEQNCGFDQSTISPITQTQIANISASQYSVTECFGDYTSSYLVNNGNLYRITQLYTGEEPEKQEYKAITDQILSTFKFTE